MPCWPFKTPLRGVYNVKRQPDEVEQAETLARRVLPTFSAQASPDFREKVLARAEAWSAKRHRGFRWDMPMWVQLWTPALTVGAALLLTFTAWVQLAPVPLQDTQKDRGSAPDKEMIEKTFHELIQEGNEHQDMGNDSQAIAAYRKAVNQIAYPLNELAWLTYQQGEAARGETWARLAVQLQPEKAEYLDTLAVILCTLGEREEALRVMEKAARLDTGFEEKLARLRRGECQ